MVKTLVFTDADTPKTDTVEFDSDFSGVQNIQHVESSRESVENTINGFYVEKLPDNPSRMNIRIIVFPHKQTGITAWMKGGIIEDVHKLKKKKWTITNGRTTYGDYLVSSVTIVERDHIRDNTEPGLAPTSVIISISCTALTNSDWSFTDWPAPPPTPNPPNVSG